MVEAALAAETLVVEAASAAETLEVAAVAVEMIVIAYSLAVSHSTAPKMLPDHTFNRFSPMLQMFEYHQAKKIRAN